LLIVTTTITINVKIFNASGTKVDPNQNGG